MRKSKYATAITEANGGIHNVRQLKQAQDRIRNNPYIRPILVHMVLTGFDAKAPYQKAIKAIKEKLVDFGCPTDYFAAWENDVNKWKGLHVHVFFLIETLHKFPKSVLRVTEGAWLERMATKWGMNRPHLSKPKNRIHRKGSLPPFFARPIKGDGRLEDCCDWISYGYKKRSKEAMPFREIYANSTFKATDAKRNIKLIQSKAPLGQTAPAMIAKPAEVLVATTTVGNVSILGKPSHLDGIETMSSIEVVDAINEMRGHDKDDLQHAEFVSKVKEVLGPIAVQFAGHWHDSTGRTLNCYYLPKREATLMMMSDSLEVQTQVYDAMVALEEKAEIKRKPKTYVEALLELVDTVTKAEALQLKNSPTALRLENEASLSTY